MIVNPFSAVKVMIVFAGCVLLVNGIADFAFLFLIRKGIRTLTEFRQRAKEKEEAAAAELREQEPAYAPWSSRNKQKEENKKAEDTQGQENDESEGDDPSPIETGKTELSEKTATEDASAEEDDDEETDASARNMENYEAKRQEEPQEEHVIEE